MTAVAAPTAEQAIRTAYARIAKPGQPAPLSTVYQMAEDRSGLDILDLMDAVDAMRVAGKAEIRLLAWTITIPAAPAETDLAVEADEECDDDPDTDDDPDCRCVRACHCTSESRDPLDY